MLVCIVFKKLILFVHFYTNIFKPSCFKLKKPHPIPNPMACHLSITMHNIMPDKPSEGIHVPFHTIVMDPFRKPFTFGPKRCDVKNGSHIGLESDVSVAATFVGTEGEFLVMSADQFVIFTPKQGGKTTVGNTLFPKETTHDICVAEKEKSYPITIGAVIMAYNFNQAPNLKSVTVFMGMNPVSNVYHSAQGAMAQSLVYFNAIWKAISDQRCVTKEAFKPTEVSRETYPDMLLVMHATCPKPPPMFIKPRTPIPKLEPLAPPPTKRTRMS
jgi:hypothetical protein